MMQRRRFLQQAGTLLAGGTVLSSLDNNAFAIYQKSHSSQ